MNAEEQKKKVLDYLQLAGEEVLRVREMERMREELGLTHEEILKLSKEKMLASFDTEK